MTTAIRVTGLRKSFGRSVALDGLNLEVATGEIHGFLGPNGSGKSTTLRILLGLLRADGGTATLLGGDPWTDAERLHRPDENRRVGDPLEGLPVAALVALAVEGVIHGCFLRRSPADDGFVPSAFGRVRSL